MIQFVLFAIYVDSFISELRQSGYGLHIGTLYVGCVVYSITDSFLQRLVDICAYYGSLWDIK